MIQRSINILKVHIHVIEKVNSIISFLMKNTYTISTRMSMKIVTEISVDPATACAHETFTEINHVLDHKNKFYYT